MTDGSERWGRARVTRRQVLTAAGAAAVGVGLAPLASSWNVRVSRAAQTPVRLTRGKVVIGVLNDQSGLYADLSGKKGVEAVRMAVEDFQKQYGANALGGPIEVVDADHQNKPDLGAQKAQEMYQRDGVGMITDVDTSSVGIAVANIAAQQRQLCLNVGSATTALTNANCNKYTFHYAYDTYMLANGTGVQVTKQVGKNWYLVYPDYAFGQDMIHSFTPAIRSEEHTSELQSRPHLVCRLLLENKKLATAYACARPKNEQMICTADLVFVLFDYFFFNDTSTTEIYTLSLHDALPIYRGMRREMKDGSVGRPAKEDGARGSRSEEHTSELQSRPHLVCRLLLEKKN